MKARLFAATIAAVLATAAHAASIDMNDPLRSVGRENDVRVDAQLLSGTVSAGNPIGVTWQIQNFTDVTVAVATRVVDASYDEETRTITVSLGSEVPVDGKMPAMVLIKPGEKKVFSSAATPAINPRAARQGGMSPRYVQVKVSILRELAPFRALIDAQTPASKPQELSDALFEQWFESTDTIFLNALPVLWSQGPRGIDAEQRGAGRF